MENDGFFGIMITIILYCCCYHYVHFANAARLVVLFGLLAAGCAPQLNPQPQPPKGPGAPDPPAALKPLNPHATDP